MRSRFSSRSGGAGDAALSPRQSKRKGSPPPPAGSRLGGCGVHVFQFNPLRPACCVAEAVRLEYWQIRVPFRFACRHRGAVAATPRRGQRGTPKWAVVGRAVMAPPNSSRAGRCRTFRGAAARRRRLPHALAKSSPAAAMKSRDRPRQKLLVLHRQTHHHSQGTVNAGGTKECGAAMSRPAGRSRRGFRWTVDGCFLWGSWRRRSFCRGRNLQTGLDPPAVAVKSLAHGLTQHLIHQARRKDVRPHDPTRLRHRRPP